VAGPASDRRTEPYWNAVPDNPAAIRFNRKLVGPAGGGGIAHIKGHPAYYYDASLASHGGRCEHGDRDQSSRQELDCGHRTCLLALDGAATLARFPGQANLGAVLERGLDDRWVGGNVPTAFGGNCIG